MVFVLLSHQELSLREVFQIGGDLLSASEQSIVPCLRDITIQGPDLGPLHLMEDGKVTLVDAVPPIDVGTDGVARSDVLILKSERFEGGMLMG